jgi:integrase/recombinase XerD
MCEEEYVLRNVAVKLKEPKLPRRIPKALCIDDLELVRDACKTVREHALIEFLFATGCRAGEVSSVTRNAVDWDRKAIVVMGKGSKEREVFIGAKARIWLKRYLAQRQDGNEHLFITERGIPRTLTPHEIWYLVKRIAERVGMRERVWPHVMRHTLATTLLNQGAPLPAVQSILGHESPETTQIYAQYSGAARQEAFQRYFVQ